MLKRLYGIHAFCSITLSRSSIALSSIMPRILLQISLECFGEHRMFLPLAIAVLSGSSPSTAYRYVGIVLHFRCGDCCQRIAVNCLHVVSEFARSTDHSKASPAHVCRPFSRAEPEACTGSEALKQSFLRATDSPRPVHLLNIVTWRTPTRPSHRLMDWMFKDCRQTPLSLFAGLKVSLICESGQHPTP